MEESSISDGGGREDVVALIESETLEDGVTKEKSGAWWEKKALEFLSKGDLNRALHYLDLCLDKEYRQTALMSSGISKDEDLSEKGEDSSEVTNDSGVQQDVLCQEDIGLSPAEACGLFEKRCLIHMKLQRYDEVLDDTRRILDMRTDHSLAYKCLLVALCKLNRLEQVGEILKLWQICSPKDLDMMKCRTKLSNLIVAVKNGIDPSDAFSKVEDVLGMSYDWLLERKLTDPNWKCRPLPPCDNNYVLCLHYRFGHCSLGEKCPDAHGEVELEEWKERSKLRKVTSLLETINLNTSENYIRKLLAKVNEAGGVSTVMTEEMDGVKIKCQKALEAVVHARKSSYKWTFAIETKKPLSFVCLLYELHRQYFFISSAHIHGASSKIDLMSNAMSEDNAQVLEISSPTAIALSSKKSGVFMYRVDVVFKPDVYGTFRQTIVFDFGEDIKLMKNVSVEVIPTPDNEMDGKSGTESGRLSASPPPELGSSYRAGVTWNFGNAEVVDGMTGEKVPSQKLGFALIGKPKVDPVDSLQEPLSIQNYKERMRSFLTQEERARQEILAKYNLTAPLGLLEKYLMTAGVNDGMTRYALDGSLYGCMNLFRDVSEDTAVGRLILRSCNYLLLTKTELARTAVETNAKPRVYLCPISDKTKNSVYIDIGRTCVSELRLKDHETSSFDIQFQLDRTAFMEMKAVIDRLDDTHLNMLFPDFNIDYRIPWSPIKQWSLDIDSKVSLNPRQKEALIAITAERCETPPILVIGPFGTGKTFTLAQCIKKLLTQPNTRIMVCTHSNSAADLYIKEYLDPWVEDEGMTAATPLRIYYELRNLNSVHPTVLKYCKTEKCRFRPPSVEEIMKHQVIVVTLSTSYLLLHLDLPRDTFTHILLDEAAQAMESEAITPLLSAGPDTKLVLAGDHMQLSPELFSEEAKSHHPSLLERLHCLYPDNHPCKLMLCENYRSHSAIIEYVSDAFYKKKLECGKVQPVHDYFFPLTFFAALGEDVQDKDSTSYYNMAEVFEVVERVAELVSSWPSKWGSYRNEGSIGVLTPYADQVSRIRSRLRAKGLYCVSVERVLNVQGKQFRAVFLSTVRSFRPWVRILPETVGNEVDLGFFSNPKLLNTALTRAQSLVVVVGDPVSLSSVGKCRNLWKDFLTICHSNNSLHGIEHSQIEEKILGVELRLTWGLNPLANEFEPKSFQVPKKAIQAAAVTASPIKSKVLTVQTSTATSDVQSHFVPASVPLQHGPLAGSVPPAVVRNLRPVPVVLASPPGMRFGGPLRPQFPGGFGVPPTSVLGPDYHAAVSPIPIPNQPGLYTPPFHGFPPGPVMQTLPSGMIRGHSVIRPVVRPPNAFFVRNPISAARPMMNNPIINRHPVPGPSAFLPPWNPAGAVLPNRLPGSGAHMAQQESIGPNQFAGHGQGGPIINGHGSPLPPINVNTLQHHTSAPVPPPSNLPISGMSSAQNMPSVESGGRLSDTHSVGVPLYKRGLLANSQEPTQSKANANVAPITIPKFTEPEPIYGKTILSAEEIALIEKLILESQASTNFPQDDAQRLHAKLRDVPGTGMGSVEMLANSLRNDSMSSFNMKDYRGSRIEPQYQQSGLGRSEGAFGNNYPLDNLGRSDSGSVSNNMSGRNDASSNLGAANAGQNDFSKYLNGFGINQDSVNAAASSNDYSYLGGNFGRNERSNFSAMGNIRGNEGIGNNMYGEGMARESDNFSHLRGGGRNDMGINLGHMTSAMNQIRNEGNNFPGGNNFGRQDGNNAMLDVGRRNDFTANMFSGNSAMQQQQLNMNNYSTSSPPEMGNDLIDSSIGGTNWGVNFSIPPPAFLANQTSSLNNMASPMRQDYKASGDMSFPNSSRNSSYNDQNVLSNLNSFGMNSFQNEHSPTSSSTSINRILEEYLSSGDRGFTQMDRQNQGYGSRADQVGPGGPLLFSQNPHHSNMGPGLVEMNHQHMTLDQGDASLGAAGRSYANVVKSTTKAAVGAGLPPTPGQQGGRNYNTGMPDMSDPARYSNEVAAAYLQQQAAMGRMPRNF